MVAANAAKAHAVCSRKCCLVLAVLASSLVVTHAVSQTKFHSCGHQDLPPRQRNSQQYVSLLVMCVVSRIQPFELRTDFFGQLSSSNHEVL